MNFFKSYFLGFKTAITYPRVLLTTYLINLLLAGVFFLIASSVFAGLAPRAMAFEPLLQGFDFAVVADFVASHKQALLPVFFAGLALTVFYWVVNVFLSGGILSSLRLEKFSMKGFFGGAGYNFFPFLFLDLFAWVILLALFIGLGYGALEIWYIFLPENEVAAMWLGGILSAVFGFFIIMAMIIVTYAKVMLVVKESVNFFTRFFQALGFSFARIYVTLPLMLLLLIVPALAVWAFFVLQSMFKSTTMTGILIGFAIQQGFILVRVFFRIWMYSTHLEFYDRQYYQKKLAKKTESENAVEV